MKIKENFEELRGILQNFVNDTRNIDFIKEFAYDIAEVFINKGKVLICGNGGSNADSIHFAEEFTGNFSKRRKALPVIPLSDSSHITCVGNDFGFEEIFSRAVEAYGNENDLLIVLSTSGNSKNIIKAVEQAKIMNIKVYALLGKNGGIIKDIVKNNLIVPSFNTARIQEVHKLILHTLIEKTEEILYQKGFLT